MFMGTPHKGSSVADLGNILSGIVNTVTLTRLVRKSLLKDPQSNARTLNEISNQFIPRAEGLKIISVYERNPTGRWPCSDLVVQQDSAIMSVANEKTIPIPANHISMCKFSQSDNRYREIENAVKELVQNASANLPLVQLR
ncbi:hypothetical protein RUND412_006510 [Rhizina undulata]